jgi:cytochrome P450
LHNLSSDHSIFHECYHEVFDPPPAGLVFTAINAFVPIRWLPVKPNIDFMRANGTVHSMLNGIIQERIAEARMARAGQSKSASKVDDEEKSTDLLTFMVEQKYLSEDGDRWTEQDMLNQILNFVAGGECKNAAIYRPDVS